MNIGEIIKQKRQKRNITQTELAELLHITPQAVSRWEMNISYPDITIIPKISEILCVTADELLGIHPTSDEQKLKESLKEKQKTNQECDMVLNQSQADSIFGCTPVSISEESKKILVVDDSDFMRMMLEDILTHHGHTALYAKNGLECLNILQKETVDVCLLDIGMPVMDGIEALKKIKEKHQELKVVMLSALSQESNVKLTHQLGAHSFVVKPFQVRCLIERIG